MSFLNALEVALQTYKVDGPEWEPMGRILLIGNGGSASIAAHIANDLVKQGKSALSPDWTTMSCLANDFGWENALERWVMAQTSDDMTTQLIAISSSGRSENILKAAEWMERNETTTLTGFDSDNPLRKLGHTNYYVPSHNYGIVECAHLAILHSIVNPGEL